MAQSSPGIDPTRVDTTQQYPPGYEIGDPRAQDFPLNVIRYIKAAAAIAAGDALRYKTDETLEPHVLTPVGSATHAVAAIAHVAIASGSFGWVTVKGRVPSAKIGTAVTAGAILTATEVTTTADAGELVVLTHGTAFSSTVSEQLKAQAAGIGIIALDSASTSESTVEVMIN